MKKIFVLCLLSPFGIAMWPHDAAALTGNELYQSCSTKKASSELTCTAYVHGFIDGMIMGYTVHGTSRGYCPPVTGISVAQGRSVIEKWLRDHPERRGTEASILSGLALVEAYPCKPGSN